jgi:hypothetical protein
MTQGKPDRTIEKHPARFITGAEAERSLPIASPRQIAGYPSRIKKTSAAIDVRRINVALYTIDE